MKTNWSKIETAPKDAVIDLWVKRFTVGRGGKVKVENVGRVTDARWDKTHHMYRNGEGWQHQYGAAPEWVHYDDMNLDSVESETDKATHWMPLPEPPDER